MSKFDAEELSAVSEVTAPIDAAIYRGVGSLAMDDEVERMRIEARQRIANYELITNTVDSLPTFSLDTGTFSVEKATTARMLQATVLWREYDRKYSGDRSWTVDRPYFEVGRKTIAPGKEGSPNARLLLAAAFEEYGMPRIVAVNTWSEELAKLQVAQDAIGSKDKLSANMSRNMFDPKTQRMKVGAGRGSYPIIALSNFVYPKLPKSSTRMTEEDIREWSKNPDSPFEIKGDRPHPVDHQMITNDVLDTYGVKKQLGLLAADFDTVEALSKLLSKA